MWEEGRRSFVGVQGSTRLKKAQQGSTRLDKAQQGSTRPSKAQQGPARPSKAQSLAADVGSRGPEVGGAEHRLAADGGSWEAAGVICCMDMY